MTFSPCSNQNGIKTALEGKMAQKIKGRVENMLKEVNVFDITTSSFNFIQQLRVSLCMAVHCIQVDVPAQILLATGKDHFRKPERGMWDYFIEHGNEGKEPGTTTNLCRRFFIRRQMCTAWCSSA